MSLEHVENNTNVLNEDDNQQPSIEVSARISPQDQESCSVNNTSSCADTSNDNEIFTR